MTVKQTINDLLPELHSLPAERLRALTAAAEDILVGLEVTAATYKYLPVKETGSPLVPQHAYICHWADRLITGRFIKESRQYAKQIRAARRMWQDAVRPIPRRSAIGLEEFLSIVGQTPPIEPVDRIELRRRWLRKMIRDYKRLLKALDAVLDGTVDSRSR